jgi:hypothetical protein
LSVQARSVLTVDDVSPGTLASTSTAPIATARELTGGAAGPVAGELLAHLDDEHPVLSALPAPERLLAAAWLAGYRSARIRDAPPLRCAAGYVRPQRAEPLRAAAAVGAYARDPMLGAIPRRRTPLCPYARRHPAVAASQPGSSRLEGPASSCPTRSVA